MNVPGDLYYTESHEWVRITGGGQALCGITDHAQEMLGDIVYVELPAQGDAFGAGEPMAVVESVKTASDVYAPVGGKVARVNGELNDDPGLINKSCYDAWLVEFEETDTAGLLTAEEYVKLLEAEAGD